MSLSQNKIKLLRSLQLKKFRQKYNFFIAEGPKIIGEILASKHIEPIEVFALDSWISDNLLALQSTDITITSISAKELKKISALQTPNLVLLLAKIPNQTVNHSLTAGMHIYCDRIQDPGNLGTIIRIADWFGISSVATCTRTVDFYNPKVIQATMGSICRLPLLRIDDSELKSFTANFKHIIGASLNGEELYQITLPEHFLLVIGNESAGISALLSEYCNKLVTIPSAKKAETESLNAAIATSIFCSEYSRTILPR